MLNKTYRLVALLTLSVMLLCTALPALASDEFVEASQFGDVIFVEDAQNDAPYAESARTNSQTRWTNTDACSVNLTIVSNGSYEISATCTAKSAYYSITIKLELQKKSGSSWSTSRTWYGSGSGIAVVVGSGTVGSGTYRAKATFNVSGEEIILYSKEKTYP